MSRKIIYERSQNMKNKTMSRKILHQSEDIEIVSRNSKEKVNTIFNTEILAFANP